MWWLFQQTTNSSAHPRSHLIWGRSKATTSNPTESAWLYSWFCTIKLYRISCTTWFCTVQWKSSFSLVRTFLAAKAGTQLRFKGSIITSWFFKACFVSLNYLDISSYYFLMELTEEATTVEKWLRHCHKYALTSTGNICLSCFFWFFILDFSSGCGSEMW